MSIRRKPLLQACIFASCLVGLIALSDSAPIRWAMRLIGRGVETQSAYEAFGQLEWLTVVSRPSSRIEAAELALAAESLDVRPPTVERVHPPGTVVTLEYTALGPDSEVLDRWQSRAIVPSLGDGGALDDEVWQASVPDVEHGLLQRDGLILRGSGETGLPVELVLRTPIGAALELPMPTAIATVDAFDWQRRTVRRRDYEIAGRTVRSPQRLHVRLVAACTPRIEVAERVVLETSGVSIVPVPLGFREQRWVQMIGCRSVVESPRPGAAVPAGQRETPATTSTLPLLRIGRDGVIDVDEGELRAQGRTLRIRIETICRFDPESDRWEVLRQSPRSTEPIERSPVPLGDEPTEPRALGRLAGVALYWIRWSEGFGGRAATPPQTHQSFAWIGGMLCNDVHLAPAPRGRVAVCIPYSNHATATYVPDPVEACRPRAGAGSAEPAPAPVGSDFSSARKSD